MDIDLNTGKLAIFSDGKHMTLLNLKYFEWKLSVEQRKLSLKYQLVKMLIKIKLLGRENSNVN